MLTLVALVVEWSAQVDVLILVWVLVLANVRGLVLYFAPELVKQDALEVVKTLALTTVLMIV